MLLRPASGPTVNAKTRQGARPSQHRATRVFPSSSICSRSQADGSSFASLPKQRKARKRHSPLSGRNAREEVLFCGPPMTPPENVFHKNCFQRLFFTV